jgi:hypothetical protein
MSIFYLPRPKRPIDEPYGQPPPARSVECGPPRQYKIRMFEDRRMPLEQVTRRQWIDWFHRGLV